MNSQLPLAVRATAAALAVFMTIATLNGMISEAEPQQSQLMARAAANKAERMALTLVHAEIVAQMLTDTLDH
jgi:hypothetical protein